MENLAEKIEEAKVMKESPTQMLARLQAENLKLKAQIAATPTGGAVRVKITEQRAPFTNGPTDQGVSTSGRISMYGVQRMPVTLGIDQWNRVYTYLSSAEWKKFVADNQSKFSHKV